MIVLKRLHLRSCRLMPSLSRPRKVPQLALTHLTLSNIDYASFIRPETVPHLRSLAFLSDPPAFPISWDDLETLPPYHGPVPALAHQLTSLCLDSTTTEYLTPHAHLFTNLLALDTRFLWTAGSLPFFANLPNPLRHLRIEPTPQDPALRDKDWTGSSHVLAFMHTHLELESYPAFRDLEHLRLSGHCVVRLLLHERLRTTRPGTRMTYDDDRSGGGAEVPITVGDDGLPYIVRETNADEKEDDAGPDQKFHREFQMFVDDAEEAEERRMGGLAAP